MHIYFVEQNNIYDLERFEEASEPANKILKTKKCSSDKECAASVLLRSVITQININKPDIALKYAKIVKDFYVAENSEYKSAKLKPGLALLACADALSANQKFD